MTQDIDFSKIYSVSRLKIFKECPKAYHFSYIDPIMSKMKNKLSKETHNIWGFQTIGKAVHNAITIFYHAKVEEHSAKKLKDSLAEGWISEAMPNKKMPLGEWGGFKTLEEERAAYRQALIMLNNFLTIADLNLKIEFLPTKDLRRSIEDYKKLVKPISSDVDISGKLDLVAQEEDGSLHIIDFKTGKREDGDDFQLQFYKLLACLNFGKSVKKASFYYLRTARIAEFKLEEDRGEEIKDKILRKVETIKNTKDFPPKPSSLCRYCIFKTFCPASEEISKIIKGAQEEHLDDLPF